MFTIQVTIQLVDCGKVGWDFPWEGRTDAKKVPDAKNNAPYKVNLCFCESEGLIKNVLHVDF